MVKGHPQACKSVVSTEGGREVREVRAVREVREGEHWYLLPDIRNLVQHEQRVRGKAKKKEA